MPLEFFSFLVSWRWRVVFNGDMKPRKPQQCKTREARGECFLDFICTASDWVSVAVLRISLQETVYNAKKVQLLPKDESSKELFVVFLCPVGLQMLVAAFWQALMKMHISTGYGENGQCHRNTLDCECSNALSRGQDGGGHCAAFPLIHWTASIPIVQSRCMWTKYLCILCPVYFNTSFVKNPSIPNLCRYCNNNNNNL